MVCDQRIREMPELTDEEFKQLSDRAAKADDFETQYKSVLANRDDLLGEKKKEAEKRRKAEELAEQEANEKHLASSNYKELHKSSEAEREKLLNELTGLKGGIAKEKLENTAQKLAAEMAEGYNVDLLAKSVAERLKYTDDKVQVVNADGELTVSSLDDLKKEFQNDVRFASLLKGNKSSGGGASGGSNGSGAAKEMTREQFDALTQQARSKFAIDGGKVID